MSDPSSSTPSLTPQSTGTQDSSPSVSAKKSRRQVAFYPNHNAINKPQKPFSRSAAKRESVMALGSIEHLQHYFTKTGIAAKKESKQQRKGLVPALGGANHMKGPSSLGSILEFELPPSPVIPMVQRPAYPPYVKTYETDPENLRPAVIEDLIAVERAWRLTDLEQYTEPDPGLLGVDKTRSSTNLDVLTLLKTTTYTIRSVRNYLVSLPDETVDSHRQHFRPASLASSAPAPKRLVSQPNDPSDPLTLIRRSALDVLTVLRALEESSRLPLSDDAYDAQSDHGSHQGSQSRVASPSHFLEDNEHEEVDAETSFAFSVVQVQGRNDSVLVWEEEDADMNPASEEGKETKEGWDDRVLAGGWLYKQDVDLDAVKKEQEVVGHYLDVVDKVLFGGQKGGIRGWDRERDKLARKEVERDERFKSRRVSAPTELLSGEGGIGRKARRVVSMDMMDTMRVTEEPEEMDAVEEEEECYGPSVQDEDLPEWAKRTSFAENSLARAHALLIALLPTNLLTLLPRELDRTELLLALSSGQALCVAYNVGVRRSRKPWGYISKEAIHDILALEQAQSASGEKEDKGRKGWTFRRSDNLRLWAAALKLRYLIPIVAPSPPLGSTIKPSSSDSTPMTSPLPSTIKFPNTELQVYFDARTVARRDEGWEEMLEQILERWVQAVVDERRAQH